MNRWLIRDRLWVSACRCREKRAMEAHVREMFKWYTYLLQNEWSRKLEYTWNEMCVCNAVGMCNYRMWRQSGLPLAKIRARLLEHLARKGCRYLTYVCTYARTHTRTHTHIHIHTNLSPSFPLSCIASNLVPFSKSYLLLALIYLLGLCSLLYLLLQYL